MQRVGLFTQVYADLTPKDERFAQWLIDEWLLQFMWAEAKPLKEEASATVLMPNGKLKEDQKVLERILNRLCGLNRF